MIGSIKCHQPRFNQLKRLGRSSGFTLIEIIVVVAIIGVMVAVMGIQLSRDADRVARLEAKRFHAIVNEVRDEAILAGEAFVLEVIETKLNFSRVGAYSFSGASGTSRKTNFDQGLLAPRTVERGIGVRWRVFGEPINDDEDDAKKVLMSPLGEITPFEIAFIGEDNRYEVYVDEQGQLAERIDKIF